ncbi:MAG: DMT family transporter [Alphaproteobacteria bacterium]|nr:DMT family transporter [Alphaproteobacteria bacterium]
MMIPLLFILMLGASWGVHFPLLRFMGEQGYNFTSIIAVVVAGVALCLTVISVFRKRLPAVTRPALIYYSLCGVTGYLLPFCFELYSAPKIGAGLLSIIVTLTPIFTVILTMAIKVEPITKKKILAVACGLLAVLPLFDVGQISMDDVYGTALLAAVMVPICYAVYYIYVLKLWPEGMDSWQVATGESLACAMIIIPLALATGQVETAIFADRGSLMVMAVMVTLSVTEVYLYFEAIRRAGVVFVSQTNFIAVGMSVVLGIIMFGETHSWWIIICLGLLAASLTLSAKETKSRV